MMKGNRMQYRKLGKTDLDVSAIGLGTEYLNGLSEEIVVSVVRTAIENGINYMDLFFAHPEIRDRIGVALKGRRDKMIVAGHLGAAARSDGQYYKTRDAKTCEKFFLDLLKRLRTDYVDVLMLHFVDLEEEYERVFNGDALELARRFRDEGKARFIGMSGHNAQVAMKAIKNGYIDVLMYPINITGNAMPDKSEFLNVCVSEDVGLVAMKPFAGGKLLQKEGLISLGYIHSGWKGYEKEASVPITPAQCINYTLSQIGVCTIVPGVKSVRELEEALYFLDATDEEKDFSGIIKEFQQYQEGGCVYCNHCLPCPSSIDIGRTIRLFETAKYALSDDLTAIYDALSAKASDCVECGDCMERCPFDVDVISKMREAVELFEGA